MTTPEAIKVLRDGGELVDVAEAVGHVINDPDVPLEALMLGLKYDGLVAEQAALALYERTGRSLPEDRTRIVTSCADWSKWIDAQSRVDAREQSRHRPEPPGRKKIG